MANISEGKVTSQVRVGEYYMYSAPSPAEEWALLSDFCPLYHITSIVGTIIMYNALAPGGKVKDHWSDVDCFNDGYIHLSQEQGRALWHAYQNIK